MTHFSGEILARCPTVTFQGTVQRVHARHIAATNFDGHMFAAGRMHMQGAGRIVYTSLDGRTAVLEMVRHLLDDVPDLPDVGALLQRLRSRLDNRRISEFAVDFSRVCDLSDLGTIGIREADFLSEHRWQNGPFVSQQIGQALRHEGYEACLVPSATRTGLNLIVFPDNQLPESRFTPIRYWDPPLVPATW